MHTSRLLIFPDCDEPLQFLYVLLTVHHLCVFQILDGELTDKYRTVQDLVDTKAKKVQDAKKKAERLRDEAKELLRDAQNKLQRLAGEWRG